MENPCDKCREYDICQEQLLPCKRHDAYLHWKEKCKEIRKHTQEVMARAKKEHSHENI